MQDSASQQERRLLVAGYPKTLITAVAESVHKRLKMKNRGDREVRDKIKKNLVIMPYIHGISHRLKKVAARNDVRLVCSAPCKLSKLCMKVSQHSSRKSTCSTKHVAKHRTCDTCVVYSIPLKCGRYYIGQTGRCVNDRMREHANLIPTGTGGNLPLHCKECGCNPIFSEVSILGKAKTQQERELIEAYQIYKLGPEKCVSAPSVFLTKKEFLFLGQCRRV